MTTTVVSYREWLEALDTTQPGEAIVMGYATDRLPVVEVGCAPLVDTTQPITIDHPWSWEPQPRPTRTQMVGSILNALGLGATMGLCVTAVVLAIVLMLSVDGAPRPDLEPTTTSVTTGPTIGGSIQGLGGVGLASTTVVVAPSGGPTVVARQTPTTAPPTTVVQVDGGGMAAATTSTVVVGTSSTQGAAPVPQGGTPTTGVESTTTTVESTTSSAVEPTRMTLDTTPPTAPTTQPVTTVTQ